MSIKYDGPNKGGNDPANFDRLPIDEQLLLYDWIEKKLTHRKTPNTWHSSYGLKHIFERDTGLYVDNGTFKGAMAKKGFVPIDAREMNWQFRISEKSPAFQRVVM